MMRSMFSGVSGLRNHQIRMDVIGNNIANVNTVGFKSGRVNFAEVFSQTLRGAASPTANTGGTNPQQVGLGMAVSSIDTLHTQGNLQVTGKMTDMAIQGNGFFVVTDGGQRYFTRAGDFDVDAQGNLVNPSNGMKVMGWIADSNGAFGTKDEANLQPITIAVGSSIAASATIAVAFAGNLDASAAIGTTRTTSVEVYDSLGKAYALQVTFTKTNTNTWDYAITDPTGTLTLSGNTGTLVFSPSNGAFVPASSTVNTLSFTPTGSSTVNIVPNFNSVIQQAGTSTAQPTSRNGYQKGDLESFTIDSSGVITGVYSNGLNQPIAQVALGSFPNPGGLLKRGDNIFVESNNAGLRQIGEAQTGGRGAIAPANLEMSNVDLSQEFTQMIITERGFQANTRVITTSDQMLQELVNLVR